MDEQLAQEISKRRGFSVSAFSAKSVDEQLRLMNAFLAERNEIY